MQHDPMSIVIDGKRYDTEKSKLIASDAFWDGSNWERSGRNTFLFRTKNGRYFVQNRTCWQGEHDRIVPLDVDEAITLWEDLSQLNPDDAKKFDTAFPGIEVEEA